MICFWRNNRNIPFYMMKKKGSKELILLINSLLPYYSSFYGKSSRKIARSPSLLVCYSFKKATASLVSSRYLIVCSYSFEARHIKIGRASCRERVGLTGGVGSVGEEGGAEEWTRSER